MQLDLFRGHFMDLQVLDKNCCNRSWTIRYFERFEQAINRIFLLQIGKPHQIGASKDYFTVEQMGNLVKDAFNSASERDIHTGDHFDVFTITSGGIQHQRFDLKQD
jgi:hypothetical protein